MNLLPICVSAAGSLRPNFFALEQSPKPTPAKLALEPSSTFEMVVATDIPAVAQLRAASVSKSVGSCDIEKSPSRKGYDDGLAQAVANRTELLRESAVKGTSFRSLEKGISK